MILTTFIIAFILYHLILKNKIDDIKKCRPQNHLEEQIKFDIDYYGEIKSDINIDKTTLIHSICRLYPKMSMNNATIIANNFFEKSTQEQNTSIERDKVALSSSNTTDTYIYKLCNKLLNSPRKLAISTNGLYDYYYIPSLVKKDNSSVDVWLCDQSKLEDNGQNGHYKLDDKYEKYIFNHVIYKFNENSLEYDLTIWANTKQQLIRYSIHKNSSYSIHTKSPSSIEVKFYKFIKKLYWDFKYTDKFIYSMSWREFEKFIEKLFKNNGYSTILTPPRWDEGKDVIAIKDGITYFIECKHWREDSLIGREYLQKLVGAAVSDNVTNVIFVTTCAYNDNAINYAKKINASGMVHLELWGIKEILSFANGKH